MSYCIKRFAALDMKKGSMTKILLFIFLSLPFLSLAQPENGPGKEKIEAIRKNVYSRVLQLTDDEAKRFWPVFDQMQAEIRDVRKEMARERRNVSDNYSTLSDADMEKALDHQLALEQRLLDIRKKYATEFKKVIPMKKVILIPRAEMEFKKELIQRLKEFKGEQDE